MIYYVIVALPLMMTGSGIFFSLISGLEEWFEKGKRVCDMPRVIPNLAGLF